MKRLINKAKGPGGVRCPCCNVWYYEAKHGKPRISRVARRKDKLMLNFAIVD